MKSDKKFSQIYADFSQIFAEKIITGFNNEHLILAFLRFSA